MYNNSYEENLKRIKYHLDIISSNHFPDKMYVILSLDNFIKLVHKEPLKFHNYCEIVILNNGDIVLPVFSSHINILELEYYNLLKLPPELQCYEIKNNQYLEADMEEMLEVTEACLVWYNLQKLDINNHNEKVLEIIDKLNFENIIIKNIKRTKYHNIYI